MILKFLGFFFSVLIAYSLIKTQSAFSKKTGILFTVFISKISWFSLMITCYYGFKTFSEFWDESYDEADDSVRTYEIGKLLQDINNMSQKEKTTLQTAVNSTVEHNYNWFYSAEFEKLLWNELQGMMAKWI